ncbi:MAG: maleylpyruvate isomerase family mycothiol-dependent enzyme [Actinomycetia bacterium]|nr:maleylpyruvate isomerase family mycothiol-dependent enzyme [Actinomycetes bacterium]
MTIDYPAIIETQTNRIAELLTSVGPESPVPTCGDWSLHDLAVHTSSVHRMGAAALRGDELVKGRPQIERFDPDSTSLSDWISTGLGELLAAITNSDGTSKTWSFAGPKPASFWPRRIAAETAVHRWDASHGAGLSEPFDPEFAVDMIDEFLEVVVGNAAPDAFADAEERTLHLHATDAAGEWVITRHSDHIEVEHAHAKSTTAVRGGASSLVLVVWNRPVQPDVEIFGDSSQLDDWSRAFSF